MREQIKLIFDSKDMDDCNQALVRMGELQKKKYNIVDVEISENTNEYYLEVKAGD
jgi:hypothetical protein